MCSTSSGFLPQTLHPRTTISTKMVVTHTNQQFGGVLPTIVDHQSLPSKIELDRPDSDTSPPLEDIDADDQEFELKPTKLELDNKLVNKELSQLMPELDNNNQNLTCASLSTPCCSPSSRRPPTSKQVASIISSCTKPHSSQSSHSPCFLHPSPTPTSSPVAYRRSSHKAGSSCVAVKPEIDKLPVPSPATKRSSTVLSLLAVVALNLILFILAVLSLNSLNSLIAHADARVVMITNNHKPLALSSAHSTLAKSPLPIALLQSIIRSGNVIYK